jgi:hypothetical protein
MAYAKTLKAISAFFGRKAEEYRKAGIYVLPLHSALAPRGEYDADRVEGHTLAVVGAHLRAIKQSANVSCILLAIALPDMRNWGVYVCWMDEGKNRWMIRGVSVPPQVPTGCFDEHHVALKSAFDMLLYDVFPGSPTAISSDQRAEIRETFDALFPTK